MAEVGLLPAAPAPAVAEVEEPAPEVAAVVEEAVPEEPALDVTPPADAAVDVDSVIAATFGLLRAEPDGSVVIAGSGRPGSKVQVFANGELLGAVEVEASGDWVFVPDAPLSAGGLEITLGEEGKDGTAEDSFIVVINEDKTSQPLVVASKPGEASEVLQGLVAPTAIAGTADAAETPAVAAASEPAATEEPTAVTAAAADTPAEPTEPATATMDVAALPEAAATPEAAPAATTAETPAAAASPEPAAAVADAEPAATSEPAVTAESPATAEPADAATADPATATGDADVAATDTDVAATETETPATAEPAATEPPAVIVADIPPTIDAIEIETDRTFFAGAGPDGGVIRLYVDDSHVADAVVSGGRWLVEAGPVLDKPSQRVRGDLLQPNSATVVGRAEVDFVVDVPAVDAPVAVAEAPAPEAQPEPASAPEAAAPEAVDTPPAPEAAVEPETAQTAATEPAEPVSEPEAVAVAAQPATDPAATEAAPVEEPAVVAETPAEPAVPTMVAVSLGDPEAQRFASGKAIIRRGDNLWTIARRVYGEGLKYTTIYQANTGQIRDPDRIYPGQVFDLPQGTGE